jgi:two-component system sensor histidine kinase HydH
MRPIEAARKADTRHTIIMAFVLLLIGFAGIVSLFLAQAYRSTRTSLTRIKAFSDNVVENMPVGLMAIDADGKVASFNQTAEAILRRAPSEIIGKMARDVLPSELLDLTAGLETGKRTIEKEIDCPLGDGRVIPMDVSISPLGGEDGTFLGYIILFRDLTEVQELKREIETSRRLASLGRLAAGIAHEIRNPLSSIKGFATYFKERYRENSEDNNTADIMIQEVDRLNRVIGQLLEFARPMAIHKKAISLQTLMRQALKMIERQAKERDITVQADLPSDIQEVPVDPDKVNQVLLNLYLNAIEAMQKGGTLTVALSRESDASRVKIVVSDTGVGISKDDLEHIFDPYFTTRQTGTGLGLAIVHRILESHNGEVRVQSEPGLGTTVSVYLPVSQG